MSVKLLKHTVRRSNVGLSYFVSLLASIDPLPLPLLFPFPLHLRSSCSTTCTCTSTSSCTYIYCLLVNNVNTNKYK